CGAPLPVGAAGLHAVTRALLGTGRADARARAVHASLIRACRPVLPGARCVARLRRLVAALHGAGSARPGAEAAGANTRAGGPVLPLTVRAARLRNQIVALL